MKMDYFIGDLVYLVNFFLLRKAWKGKCVHFHEMDHPSKHLPYLVFSL